ncbi:hypothetical protein TNCT_76971 [Trichonephila clavata]|uniref:Uncharacterized protein n=1 Tax=Trichonephila clavata TaxID=2740835 RepID=A0A8X6K5X5_TRICU|nr:hypothetical protein TNCT_76971 [Trichonephila clavata]
MTLTSRFYRDLELSRRRRHCSFVRVWGTHVLSFFNMPIASKCREIVCDDTNDSAPSSYTIDLDRASIFCHKGPHRTALDDKLQAYGQSPYCCYET